MDPYSAAKEVITTLYTVYQKCKDYQDADKTLDDAKACLKAVDARLEIFAECLKHMRSDLNDRQRDAIQTSLDKLSDVLTELGQKLPEKSTFATKMTWTAWGKRRAEKLIDELRAWDRDAQGMFFILDLVGKLRETSGRNVDEIRKRLFDTGDRAFAGAWTFSERIYALDESIESRNVPHFPAASFDLPPSAGDRLLYQLSGRTLYLEAHYIEEGDQEHKQKQISSYERLAYAFQPSDSIDLSVLHLLQSAGVIEQPEFDRYYIAYDLPQVFSCPSSEKMPTLARALERQARMTLEDRFRIAVEVSVAVFSVHAAGWVHKNIRSDNVLINIGEVPKDTKETATVGAVFLVGFQATRPRIEGSEQRPEMDPVKRLYQHPERQGGRDSRVAKFDIRHDMYSLGAVLIEIGYRKTLREIFKVKSTEKEPAANEERSIHRDLQGYARRLSDKMGTKYADAALACLTKSTVREISADRLREEFYDSVLQPLKEILRGLQKTSDRAT